MFIYCIAMRTGRRLVPWLASGRSLDEMTRWR